MLPGKSKAKGNKFENTTAKQLGLWMFDSPTILGRHLTSGAIKTAWLGDIVPVKQLPAKFNGSFPFLFECKHGYANDVPTFIKYTKLKQWIDKCLEESEQSETQKNIYIIAKFKYKPTILITNYLINSNLKLFTVAIPIIKPDNTLIYFYSYLFNDLLEFDFFKLFPDIY